MCGKTSVEGRGGGTAPRKTERPCDLCLGGVRACARVYLWFEAELRGKSSFVLHLLDDVQPSHQLPLHV